MKHTYSITAINNAVGIPPTADGVVMMFVMAVAVADTFALNTLYFLESVNDLADLGINAAYDVTNSTAVYQQVSEFYQQAGDGAQIWLVGVPMNTEYASYVGSNTYKNLINATRTQNNDPLLRAKIVGLCYAPPAILQDQFPFPADVTDAIPQIQITQVAMFQSGTQYSVILDGYNMSSALAPSALPSFQNATAYAVSLCITGLRPNGVSGVGFGLGRFARISIGHGCGAVVDGPMNTPTAFLTNSVVVRAGGVLIVGDNYTVFGGEITYGGVNYPVGAKFTAVLGVTEFTTAAGGYVADNCTSVQDLTTTDLDDLGNKQLFFLRTWTDYLGFYWNDGATCTGEDKAFSSQEYDRVVNRLAADAIHFYIGKQGSNVPLQKGTPDASSAWLTTVDADFYTRFIEPLTIDSGTGDITDGELITTGTNYLGTKRLGFKLLIDPTVIMGGASGTVEFSATI